MADNKAKRGGADRALIALTEKYEVAYWSKKFKVTPAKLKYAVKKVGSSAKKVEAYLAARKTAKKKSARKTTKKTTKKAGQAQERRLRPRKPWTRGPQPILTWATSSPVRPKAAGGRRQPRISHATAVGLSG
ncbi:DUF3606 domain-containing protein [Bradyrhizobium sp. 25ACV]